MVAFLLQGPLQRGCRGRSRAKDYPIAEAFGKTITLNEVRSAALELAILQGIRLPRPVADPIDYVLLLKEARQMRLPAGPEVVTEGIATTVAKMNAVSTLAQLAAKLTGQQRLNFTIDEKLLRRVLANFISVTRAQELILGKPEIIPGQDGRAIRDFHSALGLAQPSEKQLELAFRDLQEQLGVEYVCFPAWRYASKVLAPTDSEILAQFEAYKDEYPGTAGNEFGFGYKRPLVLKLEYLKVDLEKVKAQLQRPSPESVRQYYDKHKQLYVLPFEDDAGAQPDTPAAPRQYKPFEQVYEDLESRWLQEQAQAKAVEIIGEARRLGKARWEQLRREQKDAPIDLARLYPYAGEQQDTLVKRLHEKFNVKPQYGRTDWIDADQAEALPGIGASYSRTRPMFQFWGLASAVRQTGSGSQDPASMSFELGQDCRVNLQDAQNNLYLFRVIGLRRDQVFDTSQILDDQQLGRKVAADLFARRAYEYALDQARKLLPLAQQQGLEKALAQFADKDLNIRQAGMITRANANIAFPEQQVLLVDERGRTLGQVDLVWQDFAIPGSGQSVGMLTVKVTNQATKGRITAVGLNLPRLLRLTCPEILTLQAPAKNAGDFAPAGPQGYTLRYFGRGIDAGQAGKFDLLISAQEQELANTPNLSKGGIEPGQSEIFSLQLPHAGSPLTAVAFARSLTQTPAGAAGIGSFLVARLETAGTSETLRGIFPANRQNQFLRDCFVVLDSSTLLRRAAPPSQFKLEKKDGQDQPGTDELAVPRTPDLLTERLSGQAPCALIELPRRRLCYVISAGKHLPLSRAQFHRRRQPLLSALARDHHALLVRYWWNSSSIRSRTGYRDLQAQEEAPPTDQAPTQTPDEGSP